MTTERRRRVRPAQAARTLVGGASVAAVLGLVAGWSAGDTVPPQPPTTSHSATIRVVITDPAIDRDAAVAAALDAATRGVDRASVPVAGARSALPAGGESSAAHSTSHVS